VHNDQKDNDLKITSQITCETKNISFAIEEKIEMFDTKINNLNKEKDKYLKNYSESFLVNSFFLGIEVVKEYSKNINVSIFLQKKNINNFLKIFNHTQEHDKKIFEENSVGALFLSRGNPIFYTVQDSMLDRKSLLLLMKKNINNFIKTLSTIIKIQEIEVIIIKTIF
jgi:hypothetical protein